MGASALSAAAAAPTIRGKTNAENASDLMIMAGIVVIRL